MRVLFLVAGLTLGAGPAMAQTVGDCDGWQANARNVDWSDPTRTFANGAIRLVGLDTEEPAAAAFHIMVLYPDPEEQFLECRLVSLGADVGFGGISLARAEAAYDPARGLTVSVPGTSPEGEALVIAFTINRATGQVSVP
ncbi:hypothetical protein [Jannaschia pohangensis]|uniref:Uncharacterized protein n=1 Tax=Jannaschia pohangensis TaxID=390807 RepID=A0A1I3LIA7_9RHOB|nr:hypothetical protein [Jannaschia pohangensis]SFI84145.1 hypothetical protein SAMN04488095_1527 [Jannaschia pohangensis]